MSNMFSNFFVLKNSCQINPLFFKTIIKNLFLKNQTYFHIFYSKKKKKDRFLMPITKRNLNHPNHPN